MKAGMANGSVDIVVGTHALLSEDVQFKDLGWLKKQGIERRAGEASQ